MDTHTAFDATIAFPASVPARGLRRRIAAGGFSGGDGFGRAQA